MILHLSDLHFGTEQQDCLDAITHFVAEHLIEAVVVSGDLTQRARFSQFYHCKKFLEELNVPYIVIPGNHDIPLFHLWRRFLSPFHRYKLFFGEMEQTLETEHFYIIGINTIHPKYHTKGRITEFQIQEIDQKMKLAPQDKLKILLTHQPFYSGDHGINMSKDRPKNTEKALKTWASSGLNAILHGHLHVSAVYDLNKIFQLNAQHPILDIHAGTATSHRLHHDFSNSFNLIDEKLKVREYRFDSRFKKFYLVANRNKG
ncbi:metallophosphoesterase family protein [Acinetobacter sp. DSM 11652]|uniref:metallophosphoesterase family protein n=1 Tax=Acinetobacter sp. DSM 11652 TaxID=346222 RepID=UPI0008D7B63E|nr:metallophosphoesterase [Acinetobacter sp. DSM 11652]SEL19716.1 3',5'-cyclic AMP phosphodiesterase CpdA [Acinetobacter sp. DSM 11652]